MHRLLLTSITLLFCASLNAQALYDEPLRVMSFNIRYDNPKDGYHAWPMRKQLVGDLIQLHEADLLGLQEALPGQITDLLHMLPEYAIFGVARDTGRESEFVPLFYRRSRLQLLDGGTFWLSETPDQMSLGWDAALKRIVTWGKFSDRHTGKEFFFFNTHLDHRGVEARRQSIHLLLARIQDINRQGLPVLISGDFNASIKDEPYLLLTQSDDSLKLMDARLSARTVIGPVGTWAGFGVPRTVGDRIDYLFYRGNVSVLRYVTLTDGWGQQLPSDHLPVLADVLLNPVSVLNRAHAHNDYEHSQPLIEALDRGVNQVEVDLWLDNGRLFVSHEPPKRGHSLQHLERLYLEPLARRIQAYHGYVYPQSDDPFYVMLDLKSNGEQLYRHLRAALSPYRWMMEGENPAIIILLSGNRPVDMVSSDKDRFMCLDGRPYELGLDYEAELMPLISQRYDKVMNWKGQGNVPTKELANLRALVQSTHDEGKKLRLWASPEDEIVWEVLLKAGVDLINSDQLGRLQSFLLTYDGQVEN